MGQSNAGGATLPLLPIGTSLLLLGAGIGISWPHVSTRLLRSAPDGEGDLTSAAISMVQLFASGFGAAVAGVVVNAAGLTSNGTGNTAAAATWLFGLFAVVPLVGLPIVWQIVRGDSARAVTTPAE